MNERIKELLKQASKIANTDDNKDLDRNFDMIVAEKFAELIVVECAMFVVTELEGKVDSAITDATANRLEEHFGVSLLTMIEYFGVKE